jgi:predicted AlkP superfamily phosphohydrolase/phosphomutase
MNMSRKYSHVIVIGVDGAGSWFKNADTPNFDRIFENGAVTYGALSSKPTISAECWGSLLIGVGPEIHGLTNGIVSGTPYDINSAFPSLF